MVVDVRFLGWFGDLLQVGLGRRRELDEITSEILVHPIGEQRDRFAMLSIRLEM